MDDIRNSAISGESGRMLYYDVVHGDNEKLLTGRSRWQAIRVVNTKK
jgi:hypothetical protein